MSITGASGFVGRTLFSRARSSGRWTVHVSDDELGHRPCVRHLPALEGAVRMALASPELQSRTRTLQSRLRDIDPPSRLRAEVAAYFRRGTAQTSQPLV